MEVLEEMNNGEIIQKGLEDFKNIQRHMLIAKEENATKTYASLKDDYISLKHFSVFLEIFLDYTLLPRSTINL